MSKNHKKQVGAFLKNGKASFRVWAPFADYVAVKGHFSNWQPIELMSEGDGYWFATVKNVQVGQEYKYEIKNGNKTFYRNDPRALHFTTSSGNSVITTDVFNWEGDDYTPPPINQQIIYELHVGTFSRKDPAISGTFNDVVNKLEYLKNLGINMIEVMPISSMSMDRGWGYAIDYIFAIETLYGGRHEFMNLVKQAHKMGIGVIVDVVYNHFGPDESLDLWQFDGWSQDDKGGIYFYNDWRSQTPWGNTRPDYGRPEVRQYILDNIAMWLTGCHVDGLRLDSTIFIRNVYGRNNDPGADLPEAWLLMQQINDLAKRIKPSSVLIAEDIADNDYITKTQAFGGAGFDSQWELGVPHALRQALQNNDFAYLCSELTKRFNDDAFQRIIFSDSHDTAANGGARLISCINNGNSDSPESHKKNIIATAVVLTMPGIPMIFQGQEFAQDGGFNDWQQLDWQKAQNNDMHIKAHQDIICLRLNKNSNTAGLLAQNINISHLDNDNKVLVYHRWCYGGPGDDVIVVLNLENQPHDNYNIGFPRNGLWKLRFNSVSNIYFSNQKSCEAVDIKVDNGSGLLNIPPLSVLIYSQDF